MSLSGTGMLCVWTDIRSAHEAEFNDWYNREHLAERVAIPGFTRARRYVLAAPQPGTSKYLALYETDNVGVLGSPDYHAMLKKQTEWSRLIMGRFVDPSRSCAHVAFSRGAGMAGALAVLRFDAPVTADGPADSTIAALSSALVEALARPGVTAAHLLVTDAAISAVGALGKSAPGPCDTIVLIEAGTPADARSALAVLAVAARLPGVPAPYRLVLAVSR
ncbi:MAG: hypothetical protein FJX35_19820 [Alphaproteobacteria bacterium]|nr:hypothetical protein [Alphaproteobacteria bacterium]